jgi:hypothetical protein
MLKDIKYFFKSSWTEKVAIYNYLRGRNPKFTYFTDENEIYYGYGQVDEFGFFENQIPTWFTKKHIKMENKAIDLFLQMIKDLTFNGRRKIKAVTKIHNSCMAIRFDTESYYIKIEKVPKVSLHKK